MNFLKGILGKIRLRSSVKLEKTVTPTPASEGLKFIELKEEKVTKPSADQGKLLPENKFFAACVFN